MVSKQATSRYALGTFSVAGSPPFPGLIIGHKVIAIRALQSLSKKLNAPLINVQSVLSLLDEWPTNKIALERLANHLISNEFNDSELAAEPIDVTHLSVHAPIEQPRQFFCSGANYRKHVIDLIVDQARESAVAGMNREQRHAYAVDLMDRRAAEGEPYIFSKAWSSIAGPFDTLILPDTAEQPDWELELAVVIGQPAFKVKRAAAFDYVAGYTIVNDISNRELIHRQDLKAIGTDWVMGKSLPGYSPMGPYLVPAELVPNPQDVTIKLNLNGETMQNESTADMIFPIDRLIEYLTSRIQLCPGDILITGSPSGNGSHYNRYLQNGDIMEGTIEGIGTQRTPCTKL
jgi:2-keto-4-pentenoate hydratase/2-oxohepta-3-ene-1,7-dioic acid hydratase in catechol pathway